MIDCCCEIVKTSKLVRAATNTADKPRERRIVCPDYKKIPRVTSQGTLEPKSGIMDMLTINPLAGAMLDMGHVSVHAN